MTIPNNPSLNEQWTNDVTGVTYQWDGERWFVVSNADEILENYVTQDDFKTFKCDICCKKFSRKETMVKHNSSFLKLVVENLIEKIIIYNYSLFQN